MSVCGNVGVCIVCGCDTQTVITLLHFALKLHTKVSLMTHSASTAVCLLHLKALLNIF